MNDATMIAYCRFRKFGSHSSAWFGSESNPSSFSRCDMVWHSNQSRGSRFGDRARSSTHQVFEVTYTWRVEF